MKRRALLVLLAVLTAGAAFHAQRDRAGRLAQGVARLVTDWTVTPAGALTPLAAFALHEVWSPDGRHLLVSCPQAHGASLQLVDAVSGAVVQTIVMPPGENLFSGIAYARDGREVYVAGGGDGSVHRFKVAPDARLTPDGRIAIGASTFPTGLALSEDGAHIFVTLNLRRALAVVDLTRRRLQRIVPVGGYPYDVAVTAGRVLVTNWADGTVTVLDESTFRTLTQVRAGRHPVALARSAQGRIAVANANDDTISLFTLAAPQRVSTIFVGEGTRKSSSPQDLAFSADGRRLYVALAGDDAIGVVALNGPGGQLIGRIPTGWYPAGVRVDERHHTLIALSVKGFGSAPNATGWFPDPERTAGPYQDGYENAAPDRDVSRMMGGLLERIRIPDGAQLAAESRRVRLNDRPASLGSPLPPAAARITHVIYVIRENRSYDQVFGDEAFADGDPDVTIFGREVTPNGHALAERFGLFDNFYVDAEGSSDGHNWSTAADASDYTERMHLQAGRPYDFEGASEINKAPGGYLWDAAAAARITYRDYGEWYSLDADQDGSRGRAIPAGSPCAGPISTNYLTGAKVFYYEREPVVTVPSGDVLCLPRQRLDDDRISPALAGHYDPQFRSWDLRYTDLDREAEWQRECATFVKDGDLPQLEIVRLGNDHTMGAPAGGYTPRAMVAENDLALGRLVEAVTHSPYWSSTAIFVVEDDASNGPDHVDAHRSPVLVISPYGSRPQPSADHAFADTAGLLKTMELLLGLKPMSHFDAAANPMASAFTERADLRPYDALPARVSLVAKNARNDLAARLSLRLDLSHEDAVDPDEMTRLIVATVPGSRAALEHLGRFGESGPNLVRRRRTAADDDASP